MSAAARQLVAEAVIRAVDQFSAPMQRMMGVTRGFQKVVGDAANSMGAAGRQMIVAGAQVSTTGFLTLQNAIKDYADFEEQLVRIKKVFSTGMSDDYRRAEMKKVEDGLLRLSRVIPLTTKQLAELAEAAAQANIGETAADLLKFTEQSAKFARAFDIPAKQAGEAVAKLYTQMRDSKKSVAENLADLQKFLDMVNLLGNETMSREKDLLRAATQTLGMLTNLERSGQNARNVIMALNSTLISTGTASGTAAKATSNIINRLLLGESAAKPVKQALAELGLDPAEVATAMTADLEGVLVDIFTRVNKLSPDRAAAVMKGLGWEFASREMVKIAANVDEFKRQLALANDAQRAAGSVAKEYAESIDTLNARLTMMHNRLGEIMKRFVSGGFPALERILHSIATALEIIANNKVLMGLSALGAMLIVLGPALTGFGMSMMATGQMLMWLGAGIAALAAIIGAPVWAVVAVIAALGVILYAFWDDWKALFNKFASFLDFVRGQIEARIRELGAIFGRIFVGLTQAVGSAYNKTRVFVQRIINTFIALRDTIRAVFAEIGRIIDVLVQKIDKVLNAASNTKDWVKEKFGFGDKSGASVPRGTPGDWIDQLNTAGKTGSATGSGGPSVPTVLPSLPVPPRFFTLLDKLAEARDPELERRLFETRTSRRITALDGEIAKDEARVEKMRTLVDSLFAQYEQAKRLGMRGAADAALNDYRSVGLVLGNVERELLGMKSEREGLKQSLREFMPSGGKLDVQGTVEGTVKGEITVRIEGGQGSVTDQRIEDGRLKGGLNTGRSMPDTARH